MYVSCSANHLLAYLVPCLYLLAVNVPRVYIHVRTYVHPVRTLTSSPSYICVFSVEPLTESCGFSGFNWPQCNSFPPLVAYCSSFSLFGVGTYAVLPVLFVSLNSCLGTWDHAYIYNACMLNSCDVHCPLNLGSKLQQLPCSYDMWFLYYSCSCSLPNVQHFTSNSHVAKQAT